MGTEETKKKETKEKQVEIRIINISDRGAKHLTSAYTNVTLLEGKGNEEEYIRDKYKYFSETFIKKILSVKPKIFLIYKFNKGRGSLVDVIGVEEAKKMLPKQMKYWD